jgi:hypothetical protein
VKKLLSIGALMLVILVGVTMSGCGKTNGDPDFENDIVIVIVHENFQLREFTVDDFLPVQVEEIGLLSPPKQITPSYRPIIYLKLVEPGKQNVLDAVKIIEQLEFVYHAQPNYIYVAQDL